MHISEGYLSAPVLMAGATAGVAGVAVGMKKLDYDHMAQTGIVAAVFFVASLVRVPLGASGAHLILNGLAGLLLGWAAFPAIAVALLLQAVFFQHGGLTTLGVNTVIMAGPAVLCHYLFRSLVIKDGLPGRVSAFATGMLSVLFGVLILAAALVATGDAFYEVSWALVGVHVFVMVIEGVITVFCVDFLKKVQPELLGKTEP